MHIVKKAVYILALALVLLGCQEQIPQTRPIIDLSGEWQFALDPDNTGIQQQWYSKDLQDVIELPGTTDLRHKGYVNTDTSALHLNRRYRYEGAAWYRKTVSIPEEFNGYDIQLVLERTKSSKIWMDDTFVGESQLLQSPQVFDCGELAAGEHTLSIQINNDLKITPYGNVHIYTDETQTNWNGIIGDILLQAVPKVAIRDLQITPNIVEKKIDIKLALINQMDADSVEMKLAVTQILNGKKKSLPVTTQMVACESVVHLEYLLGDAMQLWDDYQQPLYELTATLQDKDISDSKSASFGMRDFSIDGTQFSINGRTTFLRGKHDACVFPLTGFPPMEAEGWLRVFKIAKSYGINHYRYHSYCPPEAAFEAADQLGIFLQPELPYWKGLDADSVAAMLLDEGVAMLKNYANHPSFVMFGPGNEIWGGHERVEKLITMLREMDSRPLYCMGANNNSGYVGPWDCADYFITTRTRSAGDTILTHTRLSQGYVDSENGGILNTLTPSTTINYDYPVAQIDMPLISHEIGQYQIYPDYAEIEKYTGVVDACNLQVFKNRLQKAGMLDQNKDFQQASGIWSALCYKAEMETALRTKGMAGFQLLDLQDFPGQGTALVGILDAFMDSKNVISREEWLQSCNDVVVLLQFPKYCWLADEVFQAQLDVANFSNKSITDDMTWKVTDPQGNIVESGEFSTDAEMGKLETIGQIAVDLNSITSPSKLTIHLDIKNTNYTNEYPIWVYPVVEKNPMDEGIVIADSFDDSVFSQLQQGANVLLFPTAESIAEKSVGPLFYPDFWNYGMFKSISENVGKPYSPGTLGILTDPKHPIFNSFPTDFHTNWQWFSIIQASRPLILDATPHDYRPVVQIVDNLERNHKMALVFECAVGDGKLLVCMSRLSDITDKPEANALYESILNYMQSDAFSPEFVADKVLLNELL